MRAQDSSLQDREDDKYDVLKLDRQLCFALYSATNKITKLFRSFLLPLGITFSQYLALMALWEKSPRTITDLAKALEIEGNTVTALVKRMERLGILSRTRGLSDERQVMVALTDEGYAIREKALAMREDLVCNLGLAEADLSDLRSSLHRLSITIDRQIAGSEGRGAP